MSNLRKAAVDCLERHGNTKKALEAFMGRMRNKNLLRELAEPYLQGIASEEGLHPAAGKANFHVPSSGSHPSLGSDLHANKATPTLPDDGSIKVTAHTRHAPGHPRATGSLKNVTRVVAKSIFDSFVLPDGRSLRKVRWYELPKLAREYRTVSRVLHHLYGHVIPADQTLTVDNVVKESVVKDAIAKAEAVNDVA